MLVVCVCGAVAQRVGVGDYVALRIVAKLPKAAQGVLGLHQAV